MRFAPADPRAQRVIAVWNARARRGRPAEFFPTFETALAARCWRVTYCCPACRTMGTTDLRDFADAHHPRAPVSVLIPKLSCERCCPNPPLAMLIEFSEPSAPAPLIKAEHVVEPSPPRQTDQIPRRPTLGELARIPPRWFWLSCDNISCSHKAATAIVPFIIRWGQDAPGDLIGKSARCQKCGHRGATMHHPSWEGAIRGHQSFPVSPKT